MAILQTTLGSALLCLAMIQANIQSGDDTSEYPIYRLSALICMAILQTTICCALLCLAILQATICGALLCLGDGTSNFLLYSACRYVSRRSLPAASRRSRRWVSRRS
jgi:hypothetical protein